MRYKITLEGSGGEIMIGKISQSQFDYWKTKNTDEIVDGLHGRHDDCEMSDAEAINDRFNFMDVFCSSGVYFERFERLADLQYILQAPTLEISGI